MFRKLLEQASSAVNSIWKVANVKGTQMYQQDHLIIFASKSAVKKFNINQVTVIDWLALALI